MPAARPSCQPATALSTTQGVLPDGSDRRELQSGRRLSPVVGPIAMAGTCPTKPRLAAGGTNLDYVPASSFKARPIAAAFLCERQYLPGGDRGMRSEHGVRMRNSSARGDTVDLTENPMKSVERERRHGHRRAVFNQPRPRGWATDKTARYRPLSRSKSRLVLTIALVQAGVVNQRHHHHQQLHH